jgi:pyruvate ferredoxin oxidoreductase gamma subunit
VPAAGVLQGVSERTVMLINTSEDAETWKHQLNFSGTVLTLPAEAAERAELKFVGATCAGAAACLLGVVSKEKLEAAFREELSKHGEEVVKRNLEQAFAAFGKMQAHAGCVKEGASTSVEQSPAADWVELPLDESDIAASAVHAGATSVEVRTGLWRIMRPVIDYERCNKCWWVCSEFCPDSAIKVVEGRPEIDYDHCKGCLVCVAQCPPHAIEAVPESEFSK